MSTLEPVRYVQGRPMLFAGIRRHHTFGGMAKGIPCRMGGFPEARGRCPGRSRTTSYGAICGADPKAQQMEYMCAVEVQSFDARAEGARPQACARCALRRVPARGQRGRRFKPPGGKSFRRGCRIPACVRRIRRTSSCTTIVSTEKLATAASRSGSAFSRPFELNRGKYANRHGTLAHLRNAGCHTGCRR